MTYAQWRKEFILDIAPHHADEYDSAKSFSDEVIFSVNRLILKMYTGGIDGRFSHYEYRELPTRFSGNQEALLAQFAANRSQRRELLYDMRGWANPDVVWILDNVLDYTIFAPKLFSHIPKWLRNSFGIKGSNITFPSSPEALIDPSRWRESSLNKFIGWVIYNFGGDTEPDTIPKYSAALDVFVMACQEADYTCEIVYGQKLLDYYNQWPWGGCKSCMVDRPYTRLYAANPDKVGLFVIKKGGQYAGRALLWTDDNGTVLLDRIYPSNSGSHIKYAKGVAKDKGWIYKKVQAASSPTVPANASLKVTLSLRNPPYCYPQDGIPYMDTLQHCDLSNLPDSVTLYNAITKTTFKTLPSTSTAGAPLALIETPKCTRCGERDSLVHTNKGVYCEDCVSKSSILTKLF